jgi:hypothetical protein
MTHHRLIYRTKEKTENPVFSFAFNAKAIPANIPYWRHICNIKVT